MRKITTVLTLLVFALSFTSCKKESLQSYLVDSQDKQGFITVDLPINFLQVKDDSVAEDVKETIKSIKKINVVALPKKGNEDIYEAEKKTLSNILSNESNFKSLMRVTIQGVKMKVYYTGDSDAIDEVVAFGNMDDQGFGVARILGENMNPAQIMTMMQNIKFDANGINLKQFNLAFQ